MEDGSHIYLLLYTDDMLIASQNLLPILRMKLLLYNEFDMKDMGVAEKILGKENKMDEVQKMIFCVRRNTFKNC